MKTLRGIAKEIIGHPFQRPTLPVLRNADSPTNHGSQVDCTLFYFPPSEDHFALHVLECVRVVTYGVKVYDSHGVYVIGTREQTAKARAVPEHVIIIGKLGSPSDIARGLREGERSGGRSTRVRKSREADPRPDVKRGRRSTFIVLPVVLESLFLATGQSC